MDLKWSDVRRDWATPPNIVSYVRFLLLLPIGLCILQPGLSGWLGVALLLVATLSDKLDGWWAKRNNGRWSTSWGKIIDPIMDKLLVGGVLIVLIFRTTGIVQQVLVGATAAIVFREIVVMWVKSQQSIQSAAEAGRFSMVAQSFAVLWLCLPPVWGWGELVLVAPLLISVGASWTSGWAYWAGWRSESRS